jgi:hypothetical protein
MQIAAVALVCGLALATLLPAPAANEDGLLTALLGAVCCSTLLMGILALFGVLTGTALLAGAGAAIMVPCAWLARAPEAPYEYEEDDDDGGGSPPPTHDPSRPPSPDRRRPAPAPVAAFAATPPSALVAPPAPAGAFASVTRTALAPAVAPAPTEPRAEPAPNPRFPHLVAPAWDGGHSVAPRPAPAPVVDPPVVVPPAPPAAVSEPVLLPPASRPARGEHPSVEHRSAAAPHPIRRRRPVARLRMLHGWRRRRWFGAASREHASR